MRSFLKNGLKLFLVFAIIFTNSVNFAFAQNTDTNNQEEVNAAPKIRMGGDGNIILPAGKETTVDIPIINTAQGYAYNLLIQAKPEKDAPFTIKFLNESNRKNIIERVGATKTTMVFNVDKNAVSGVYPVTLEFSYTSQNKTSLNNSDTLYVKIENASGAPNVVLNNFSSSKSNVIMGESFSINAILENTNITDVKNLSLQVLGLEENNMTLVGDTDKTYIEIFQGTVKKPLTFNFKTTNKTKEGSNKITFKLSYMDMAGKEYTREFQYYVTVSKSATSTTTEPLDLKITSLISPKNTLGVNQSGTFTLKIKNAGKTEAKNIKVTAKIPEGLVPTSSNIVVIPSILPNAEQTLSFSVSPTSDSKTQAYSVGFSVEYATPKSEEDTTSTTSFEQYAGVNVNNPNSENKDADKDKKTSVPKIIISKYQSTPMIVEAGKPFELAMTFKNTHSTKTTKNIKLYLTVDDKTEAKGSVFAPDNSSTTFYIDEIQPNKEISHTFNLFTVPDASPRSYTINVNFEYEDELANEYKITELVGVNVKQQSKIETSDITISPTATVGEPIYVNFQIYNTGKVNVSNLKISAEGEGFDTSSATNFIGNFNSGSSEYYDANFIPTEEGEKTLNIKISYEDTAGKVIEKNNEFKINVEPAFEPTFDPDQPENTDHTLTKNNNLVKSILITVGIIVIAVILFLYFKKRAKMKKEFDFNE